MLIAKPTVDELFDRMESLTGCCLHRASIPPKPDVAEVLRMADDEQDESESFWLFRFHDGRYGVLQETSDYTGHG